MSERGKEIDVSHIDLDKEAEKVALTPGLLEFAHNIGSALIKPEDKGKVKGQAIAAMQDQTSRQFTQIYDQMKVLMDQAKELKERVDVSERIYQSKMNFKPLINHEYHLYHDESKEIDLLSMIAPEEWGRSKPSFRHIAKVKLLSDHTWEILS